MKMNIQKEPKTPSLLNRLYRGYFSPHFSFITLLYFSISKLELNINLFIIDKNETNIIQEEMLIIYVFSLNNFL